MSAIDGASGVATYEYGVGTRARGTQLVPRSSVGAPRGGGGANVTACGLELVSGVTVHVFGVAVDGGKDSLSMVARVGAEKVKCPGQLVITVYASVDDVSLTVTPDLKADDGVLLLVDLSGGRRRLGQDAFKQVGHPPKNDA